MAVSRRRYLTLALTLWGVVVISGPLLVYIAVEYTANPQYGWSIVWTVVLLGIPVLIVSILTGLSASLGAYVGRRMFLSEAQSDVQKSARLPSSIGAGIGAMVVGTLPLGYVLSLLDGGPPASVSFAICVVLLFALFAGFASLWVRSSEPN